MASVQCDTGWNTFHSPKTKTGRKKPRECRIQMKMRLKKTHSPTGVRTRLYCMYTFSDLLSIYTSEK